ncbi:Phosphoglycolate phosphatase, HAD superfamily [Thermoactinomyces sp. DSM 45891]|uniref:HAD family hydrolase n=1 Tax=unclassified Thermoactinomyces TaxID=2634588 RepID=UPI000896B6BA|nr:MULTISPECIES: HAD family hydrolase [unclassified Thermoactinomyces]SDY41203.1 Phosphoglycolate phosphatase, HAD superfamily [Thermoactinomyces sp. DSM 45892]SFX62977.1 Phosphoglycolate phosphatase, HAD superfamily [Thermoactinomyces sp. DSM 45891]
MSLLFVFDIDGTLTESTDLHQRVYLESLRAFGYPKINPDLGAYKHFTDSHIFYENGRYNQVQVVPDDLVRFERQFHQIYVEYRKHSEIQEIPGAGDFLHHLSVEGIPFCFATGSLRSAAEDKLAIFSGIDCVPVLSTATEGETREEIVRSAIEKAKHTYQVDHFERIISIGDGVWDYQTACHLDLLFVGVAQGKQKEKLIRVGAEHIIPHFLGIQAKELVK